MTNGKTPLSMFYRDSGRNAGLRVPRIALGPGYPAETDAWNAGVEHAAFRDMRACEVENDAEQKAGGEHHHQPAGECCKDMPSDRLVVVVLRHVPPGQSRRSAIGGYSASTCALLRAWC